MPSLTRSQQDFKNLKIRKNISGLLFNDGEAWKSHRRFSLKTLKDFGFGKKSLESVLLEEADRMVDFFVEKVSISLTGTSVV